MKASHTSDGFKGTIIYCKLQLGTTEKRTSAQQYLKPSTTPQPITFQTQLQCHCPLIQNMFQDIRRLMSTQL